VKPSWQGFDTVFDRIKDIGITGEITYVDAGFNIVGMSGYDRHGRCAGCTSVAGGKDDVHGSTSVPKGMDAVRDRRKRLTEVQKLHRYMDVTY